MESDVVPALSVMSYLMERTANHGVHVTPVGPKNSMGKRSIFVADHVRPRKWYSDGFSHYRKVLCASQLLCLFRPRQTD